MTRPDDRSGVIPETVGGMPTLAAAVVFGVVGFGGLVKGLTGFGYAIASTAVLATTFAPATAVVVVILPTLAANLSLLSELDREALLACGRRFWPFVLAAGVGTLAGMALLDRIPQRGLALALGMLTLGYAALKQDRLRVPGETWLRDRCFVDGPLAKVGVGALSGVVFGAGNVAIQVVAYLDAQDLDRSTFVGVLAMVLVGISTVRVGAAAALGLYRTDGVLLVSALAVFPGVAGVGLGSRLRKRLPESAVGTGVVLLLGVIGTRLVLKGGLGI